MSHSSRDGNDPEIIRIFREMTTKERLKSFVGPIGGYPDGMLTKHDEGSIAIAVGVKDGKVVIDMGAPTAWIGFTPEQAHDLGILLIRRSAEARGVPVTIRIGRDGPE